MNEELRRRAWWMVVAWAAFQLALTSIPGDAVPEVAIPMLDKAVHFVLYAGLGALVARAGSLSGWPGRRLPLTWALIAAGGGLDELHQVVIPGRGAEAMDWLMDAAGTATGLWVGALAMRSRLAVWLR